MNISKTFLEEFYNDILRAEKVSIREVLGTLKQWLLIHNNVCIEIMKNGKDFLKVNIPIYDDFSEEQLKKAFPEKEGYTHNRIPPII